MNEETLSLKQERVRKKGKCFLKRRKEENEKKNVNRPPGQVAHG